MCQIWMSGLFFKGAFIHDSRAQTVSNQSALFLSAAGMPTKGQSWGQGQTTCASTAEVKSTFCLASPELHRCFLMSSGDFCPNVLKSDLTTKQQKNKQKKESFASCKALRRTMWWDRTFPFFSIASRVQTKKKLVCVTHLLVLAYSH